MEQQHGAGHARAPRDGDVPAPAPPALHPDLTGWSDSSARSVLQLMAESVAEMVGFEVATLCVVLDGQLVTVGYSGPEEFREYAMQNDPATVLDPVLAQSEQWGRFHFTAAERFSGELEGHWFVTVEEQADHPDAWHPLDMLLGVLRDDQGRMVGVLSVDKPFSGLRPDAPKRRLLERYAAQAERAVLTAFEREKLVHQVAHSEAARRIIRSAAMPEQASLEAVLSHTHVPLVEGFGASGSWLQVLDADGAGRGFARSYDGEDVELSERVVDIARRLAPRLWAEQQVIVIGNDVAADLPVTALDDGVIDEAVEQLAELELDSVLAVPLGAGTECIGFLALTRRVQDPPWSQVEIGSALEIGHDLGAALMTARSLERERSLVRELQALDDYRTHLISTLSHEMRTPLTVISGNLEMLDELELEGMAARYREAMVRGTTRMRKVVDDLLLLARVSHPQHPIELDRVDLHAVVDDIVALVELNARSKGLSLDVEIGTHVVVAGQLSELDRLLGNLVSNAVKYTPRGGNVAISVRRVEATVRIRVSDDGLGISEDDQASLFQSFYRTTNPDALREQGTGLGLAIVAHIAQRHGGSVAVDSRLGEGTTFTVDLPAADA